MNRTMNVATPGQEWITRAEAGRRLGVNAMAITKFCRAGIPTDVQTATCNNASTSATLVQVVRPTSATTVTSSPNPSVVGQSMIFRATVSPATTAGTVTFLDGSSPLITNFP